ncbi:hypothetical protein TNCV_2467861 [Trichonephila clavipes]|nr:hypothetical protein TNCV_2467861 [Trichonephila clavipes]
MNRRARSLPPRCTSDCENRRIVRMTMMDCATTSRTMAQQIQYVTHHFVSARIYRFRFNTVKCQSRMETAVPPRMHPNPHTNSMPRYGTAVIASIAGTLTTGFVNIHTSKEAVILIV